MQGAVVKLKCEQELAREKKDFEANFKKMKEKAKKDGGKKPIKNRLSIDDVLMHLPYDAHSSW
jgi:hypothetical protein